MQPIKLIIGDLSYITSLFDTVNNYTCIFTREQNLNIAIVSQADGLAIINEEGR